MAKKNKPKHEFDDQSLAVEYTPDQIEMLQDIERAKNAKVYPPMKPMDNKKAMKLKPKVRGY